MKIKLGTKYILNSDPHCYWITCLVKVTKGKNAGDTYEKRVSGYTATFEECVDSFIDKQIKKAQIDDFKDLVKEITNLKKEVRSWRVQIKREK